MPKIELKDFKVSYYSKKTGMEIPVFTNLNIVIPDQKVTVFLGPSGCGKTTLLNVISGLYNLYEGQVLFDDKDAKEITIRDKDVSYVKQDLWLYPLKTIFDNIAFPLKFCEIDQNEVYYRVRDIARKMGIEQCLTRRPKHISLGQQKRVALARALIKEPTLILFDEPLNSLDPILKEEMINLIKESIDNVDATVIYVTHDYQEAIRLADYIYIFGENEVIASGSKDEIINSKDEYVNILRSSVSFKVEE